MQTCMVCAYVPLHPVICMAQDGACGWRRCVLKGKSEEELMKLGAPRLLNTCMVSLVFQLFN